MISFLIPIFAIVLVAMPVTAVPPPTIEFVNTSFAEPVAIGSAWPIAWSTGNGYPLTLGVENATWRSVIFSEQSVLPSKYIWTVGNPDRFLPGAYQLRLTQVNGADGGTLSPQFVVVEQGTTTSNPNNPFPTTTPQQYNNWTSVWNATITYTYWDTACSCHKTTSATRDDVVNSVPYTTSTWFESQCGCTKSGLVAVSTTEAGNSYTVPKASGSNSVPAPPSASGQNRIAPSSASNSAGYTGLAGSLSGSLVGLVVILVGTILCVAMG